MRLISPFKNTHSNASAPIGMLADGLATNAPESDRITPCFPFLEVLVPFAVKLYVQLRNVECTSGALDFSDLQTIVSVSDYNPRFISAMISALAVPATLRPSSSSPRRTIRVERRGMLRNTVTSSFL